MFDHEKIADLQGRVTTLELKLEAMERTLICTLAGALLLLAVWIWG